jgi:hypothetical protein
MSLTSWLLLLPLVTALSGARFMRLEPSLPDVSLKDNAWLQTESDPHDEHEHASADASVAVEAETGTGVLVPFAEVDAQCLYPPTELRECVDFVRHGPAFEHAVRRRYVLMALVFCIALWSMFNAKFIETMKWLLAVDKDEEMNEVLNAVFAEVTMLGFIALVSGILSRSAALAQLSVLTFGPPPHTGPHSLLATGQPDMDDFLRVQHYPDIRDGRTLCELTVLLEDIHIGLFLIMMSLILIAAMNLKQVGVITQDWEEADALVRTHGARDAYWMLDRLLEEPGIAPFRKLRFRTHQTYVCYRQEFLDPHLGEQPDGVDSDNFAYVEYLRLCAGAAIVENVEVPIWMHMINGLFILCARPLMDASGGFNIYLVLCPPFVLLVGFLVLLWKLRRIYGQMVVLPGSFESRKDSQKGRLFAVLGEQGQEGHKVNKADGTFFKSLKAYTHGTLTPTPFERLFWFHRNGERFIALTSRLLLFWVAMYMAMIVMAIYQFFYTFADYLHILPIVIVPLVLMLAVLYPMTMQYRILITTTEYSPNRKAIRQLARKKDGEVEEAKLMLVAVLKREKMRRIVRDAALNGLDKILEQFKLTPERTRHFIDKAYYAFDEDNSGYLGRDELEGCLRALRVSGDIEDVALGLSASGLFRPASDEWFQILAPDMRGVNHAQFKVLVWAVLHTSEMELDEGEVISALTHVNRGQVMVTADELQRIVLRLTRLQQGCAHLGMTFLQDAYYVKEQNSEMPQGYKGHISDVARLIIDWDHEFSLQRGLE